ncbi:hypothetical protein ACI65C_010229 [Semiaphis heraclei]
MDQKQIEDALSDSDFSFSDESIDDSDADPLFQLSESDDESSGNESSDHESIPVQLNADNDNISSNWYPVTGNQRRSAAPKHKIEETEEKCPRNRKLRKRCSECYKKISQEKGFREALNKTKKVTTFCSTCPSQPFICLSCFSDHII